jgi:hypothetical protein
MLNESTYRQNSVDNFRSYDVELCREDQWSKVGYDAATAHGLIVGDLDSPDASVILIGVGGHTGIHANSIAHNGDECYVAVGDSVFALSIPALELRWVQKVDDVTCFGVYWVQYEKCLVTWGELQLRRYSANGEKVWSAGGRDIFTEGFEIESATVRVTDFNHDKYEIDIKTGDLVIST